MEIMTLESFLQEPEKHIISAMNGEYCKVTGENGKAAIIIAETEWTMLQQALKLCTENPQWITRRSE